MKHPKRLANASLRLLALLGFLASTTLLVACAEKASQPSDKTVMPTAQISAESQRRLLPKELTITGFTADPGHTNGHESEELHLNEGVKLLFRAPSQNGPWTMTAAVGNNGGTAWPNHDWSAGVTLQEFDTVKDSYKCNPRSRADGCIGKVDGNYCGKSNCFVGNFVSTHGNDSPDATELRHIMLLRQVKPNGTSCRQSIGETQTFCLRIDFLCLDNRCNLKENIMLSSIFVKDGVQTFSDTDENVPDSDLIHKGTGHAHDNP